MFWLVHLFEVSLADTGYPWKGSWMFGHLVRAVRHHIPSWLYETGSGEQTWVGGKEFARLQRPSDIEEIPSLVQVMVATSNDNFGPMRLH